MGRRRYATDDTSRNSLLIAITTLGEGWHNNHHHLQSSARNGFFWWEIDVTWYVLKVLSWVGVVRDLKVPSAEVRAADRVKDGTFDVGMFKAHLARAQATVAHSHADLSRVSSVEAPTDRSGAPSSRDAVRTTVVPADADLVAGRRDAIASSIEERKVGLDELVQDAMASAEELASATRKGNRELGLLDG